MERAHDKISSWWKDFSSRSILIASNLSLLRFHPYFWEIYKRLEFFEDVYHWIAYQSNVWEDINTQDTSQLYDDNDWHAKLEPKVPVITIPFLLPEMVERVASMPNYFLLQIVGPQRKTLSLKDPEKYEFRPKLLVKQDSGEVLERWNFSIETDSEVVEKGVSREKSAKEIMREIQAIMRQIASSITYLPCLDEPCIFDVLAYTDKDCVALFTWIQSDPKLIANPQMVKLHSFDTKIHKVDTLVSYKNDEWDES
ncbi:hypothetical protein CASFOL_033376 [Castilleja foliolosa]|uniref:HORMA domain-containing protein n=1 Tax=Castilleja foliolosa TaxID=1961234 RepID=A0ABD3BZ29_9LAMI